MKDEVTDRLADDSASEPRTAEWARRFRYTKVLRAFIFVGACLFLAALTGIRPSEKPFLFGCAVVLATIAVLAVLESWLAYIQVGPDAVVVRGLLSRRRYGRAAVEAVTWEKGAGVSLRLAEGGWAKLPDLGHSSQSVAGAVRAWLNRGPSSLASAVEQSVEADEGS